ncbi:MAG: carboxymuconolactone decarboxylase family protein [Proteobacteria bacterium]|nr:carboxymuconolactone decarboxylase family protein [Pseudomonadota bacterium]
MSESKAEKGMQIVRKLMRGGGGGGNLPLPAEFGRMTMEHLFGDVWQGPELAIEERSLITCSVLVAIGREEEQRIHFRGARNLGIPREKLEGMITHVAHYAGWPVAVGASRVLHEVCAAIDEESKGS